jgi:hypothetical protein
MRSLLSRLRRLERLPAPVPEDECPRPAFGAIIDAGDPMPDEADVVPCRTCGGRHVQIIHEIVIDAEGGEQ